MLSQKYDRLKAFSLAKIAKKVSAKNLVQKAKDDIMDLEVSHETVKSVCEATVKSILSKSPAQPSKTAPASLKGSAKQTAKKTVKGKSPGKALGNRPLRKSPLTQAKRGKSPSKKTGSKGLNKKQQIPSGIQVGQLPAWFN